MSGIGPRWVRTHDGSTEDSWVSYTCGWCGDKITGFVIASFPANQAPTVRWLQCPNCKRGSVMISDRIYPGTAFGPELDGLPDVISDAYKEARNRMSVNALTACELICRNILMYVAVEKGAKQGDKFENYISYLETKGYVTPPMSKWVELIRKHGNKAAHELQKPDAGRTESTLMFTAEL